MAHPVEPMDIDSIDSDFDNKENTFHHNNVQPCTEKGYEELDVSELNMRLRYSVTPAASPMSKSFNSCIDNRTLDLEDSLNTTVNEVNLTHSLNATMTKNDSVVKSLKSLPLQSLPSDQSVGRNESILRQLDSTITAENNNITVTISGTNDIDENLSLPSSSSSEIQTPEATTPTKEIPKNDGGSPIMRGLKSVLNMFRSSQSPIPPPDHENTTPKQLTPTPSKRLSSEPRDKVEPKQVLASTPIAAHRDREGSGSKRNSPLKDSIIFNDDLEKELQWKDETTILFSEEKIPIHKLFYQQKKNKVENKPSEIKTDPTLDLDATVEYMDISCNDSLLNDKTIRELSPEKNKNEFHPANESDSEFLDCENESNLTKTESYAMDNKLGRLIEELTGTENVVNNVTITTNNQEIQQINETETNMLNITVPLGTDNIQGNVTDLLTSSLIAQENIDTNISTLGNKESTCEENHNSTKVLENILQESNLEISGIDSGLNNDVTMTLEFQEIKDKSTSNMLEVSTLESHTQSLSSLIESLDATNTMDKEYKTVSKDNSLEIAAPEQPILVAHMEKENTDLTITINNQNNKPDYNYSEEPFSVPETHTTLQNLNVTSDIVSQETVVKSENFDSLEHKVVGTTINPTYEKNEDNTVTPICIAQPEPLILAQDEQDADAEPATYLTESPADIPLPDDEDIEKDIDSPTDTSAPITNDAQAPMVDRCIAEKEIKSIIEQAEVAVTELNSNIIVIPDMILETKDTLIENNITSRIQLEDQPGLVGISDMKNIICDKSNTTESEIIKDVSMGDMENINKTFDMQIPDVNETFNNVPNLPDISIEKELDDVEMMALDLSVVHFAGKDVNETINTDSSKSENTENNLLLSDNKQVECVHNAESNIGSIILPENQMGNSILVCEDILDKNREISEVILTEQQIEKLLHASNVIVNDYESKDEASQMSQNGDQLIPSNDVTITFKEDELQAELQVEVNTISQLETQDANKIVTIEENFNVPLGEVKDNIEQKFIQQDDIIITDKDLPDCKENENKIEHVKEKHEVEPEATHLQDIKVVEKYIPNEIEIADKTVAIENDVLIKDDVQNNIKENREKSLNIDKHQTIGNETFSIKLNTDDTLSQKTDLRVADDEIIVSENNSPYVSVAADLDKVSDEKPLESFEEIENPFATKTKVPTSPPITSKGYNFNFDDIDDPFATKVNIRMSPAPETPHKIIEIKSEEKKIQKTDTFKKDTNKNRRKSQPARQKLANTKKPFNTTFDVNVSVPDNDSHQSKVNIKTQENAKDNDVEEQQNMTIDFSNDINCNAITTLDVNKNDHVVPIERAPQPENIDVVDADVNKNATLTEEKPADLTMTEENKASIESVTAITNNNKTTSSSEQSTYYSAGTSSSDSSKSRNVFNLPEIDDMNFNPFATKTKIRQSPPRDTGMDNPFATNNRIMNSPDSSMIMAQGNEEEDINSATNSEKNIEDKMETEPMEKDSSANISNITSSSKGTDRDATIREINTEDEDTIEGPFLEAEDTHEDKQSDFDGENIDMMQFNDLPAQEQDENAEGELFIDAEAFEFLLNQNKSNVVADSGKESLFLKFDPLFAKRMSSDSVVAALSRAKKRQSTPTRTPKQQRNTQVSVAGPSTMNLNYEADLKVTEANEDLNATVTKPMMVVTPAVNPTAALRKSVTPTRTNRRSITFTSPAMAVIDRLLSLSANSSLVEQETIPQVSREQNEAELALTQLREVLAEKEIHVYNLRSESKELKDRLASLESQMKILETEGQQRLKKINDLNDKLAEKTKMNKSMAVVVEEYERTIASLIAETEADKKRHAAERIALMNERDEQTAHLASMEVSFNDLHSKYEKSKQVIMNYKANEETYKQSLRDFEENVTKMQKNYELLKQHATSKLNHANEELQKINRSHEAEVLKLNAMIKRKELHITSLEETLAQKTKANEELTAICDELINKVG